jgi:external thioesterase TEII
MNKPKLFLLHFAGGNCYSFHFLVPLLNNFEVIVPELPGRGRRSREPLLTDFNKAALDMCEQIRRTPLSPGFMIYGHSMGAFLALRITNLLSKENISPSCLVVSGNAGPGVEEDKKRYLLKHDELVPELKRLGGIPEEFYANKELMEFFLPILTADFEVAEKNDIVNDPPVNIPIYAIMGREEEQYDRINNWRNYTTSSFGSEILEGAHFFINKHPERIARIINECYQQTRVTIQI